jgi:ribose transport system permease protein
MSVTGAASKETLTRFRELYARIPNMGVYSVLILMFVGCVIFVPNFGSQANITNLLQHSVALGLVSIGQTFAIIAASLDLSVGISISLMAVMASLTMDGRTSMMLPTVLMIIGIGSFVGLINGLIIARLRVNPFIATLGTWLILQGVLFSSFDNFAGGVPREFEYLGYGQIGPMPVGVILFFLVAAGGQLLLKRTRFGYHLYALGGNQQVSRLSGIHTARTMIIAHVLTGLGAALTAIFIVSRLRAGAPWVGETYTLDSIAAVVIGGAPLSGGVGSVVGTVAGVLIFSILNNIFNILNVGAFAQLVLRGVILIAVVAFYSFRLRR